MRQLLYLAALLCAFAFTAPAQKIDSSWYNHLKWRCIGPYRGGRSVAVCGIPDQPLVYYAGAAGGGLWKTTDGGSTWNSVSDSTFTSSSVGAVAVAPGNTNIVYVGMGETPMRGNISFGDGIYKSPDGGATWKHMGLVNSNAIGAIVVDPHNPDSVVCRGPGKDLGSHAQ